MKQSEYYIVVFLLQVQNQVFVKYKVYISYIFYFKMVALVIRTLQNSAYKL